MNKLCSLYLVYSMSTIFEFMFRELPSNIAVYDIVVQYAADISK